MPIILLVSAVLVCVLLLTVNFSKIDIELSLKKYLTYETGAREFSFHGSFGRVHKLKVYENGDKICTLSIDARADVFTESDAVPVELCDINADGRDDILVLVRVDTDGDAHRELFINNGDGYTPIGDTDISNFTFEDGKLVSVERETRYLAQTVEEYTVPYEKYVERCEYGYIDGEVIPLRKFRLSYFSETDIYCYSVWEYDRELGELTYVSEDWFGSDEYDKYSSEIYESVNISLF